MDLLIDIGNTRIKWAWSDQTGLSSMQALEHSGLTVAELLKHFAVQSRKPRKTVISCVASSCLQQELQLAIAQHCPESEVINVQSAASAYGVTNAYREPEMLGVDRWLGLIAARKLVATAVCIADCGTAITIDVINAAGLHLGGVIAPGVTLMQRALQEGTQNLPKVEDNYAPGLADNTKAGIHNGSLLAAAGAIEKVMSEYGGEPTLILSGGDAQSIGRYISKPYLLQPDLVLLGLKSYADDS